MLLTRYYSPISLGIVLSMGPQYRGKRDGPLLDLTSKLLLYNIYNRFAVELKRSSDPLETI